MKLARYEPWNAFGGFPEEFERIMRGRFGGLFPSSEEEEGLMAKWAPAVDIKEEEDRYVVRADLPGVDAKDIDINVENGMMTISGRREEEKKEEKKGYSRMERFSGQFFRRFSLPEYADAEHVSATSKKGVLEVVIPKTHEHKPKRIQVKESNGG